MPLLRGVVRDARALASKNVELESEIRDREPDRLRAFQGVEVEATPTSARPLSSAGIRAGKGVSTIAAFTPNTLAKSLQVSTSNPIGLLLSSRDPIGGKSRTTAQRSVPELMMSSSLSALAGWTSATVNATAARTLNPLVIGNSSLKVLAVVSRPVPGGRPTPRVILQILDPISNIQLRPLFRRHETRAVKTIHGAASLACCGGR